MILTIWPSDPLLMNAFNTVNLAGACILTSTTLAEELGVPKNKWVYPLGGAGTRDSYDCEIPHYPACQHDKILHANTRKQSGTDQITTRVPAFPELLMPHYKSPDSKKKTSTSTTSTRESKTSSTDTP